MVRNKNTSKKDYFMTDEEIDAAQLTPNEQNLRDKLNIGLESEHGCSNKEVYALLMYEIRICFYEMLLKTSKNKINLFKSDLTMEFSELLDDVVEEYRKLHPTNQSLAHSPSL